MGIYICNGSQRQQATLTITSSHHIPQATYGVEPPHAGTQIATNMLTMVANPIGNVPRKSDCTGCRSISVHVAGYKVYLKSDMIKMVEKITIFITKKTMLRSLSEPW